MDELALQLKSHESRFSACQEIIKQIKTGKFTTEKREEIMEVLKEPWVEQHDTVAKLTYYSILCHYPEYLKSNYYLILNDIKPLIYSYYTQKQLPLYRNAAVVLCLEMMKTLVAHCKWRQSDLELKIITPYLRTIIDKTAAEFDLISSVRIGFALFDLGFPQLVTKFYGSQVERKLDLIMMHESLVKVLIKDSVLRLACDPLLKQVLAALSQLEKQNDLSKKMWIAFFDLGNSKNMAYRVLFFEILVSFLAVNQNKSIFLKILKSKAMRSLVQNMDSISSTSPYYANLIQQLSHAFARLNENPRFRKIIFPSAEDYRDDLADVSKMVIFATGASQKIFNFISELPEPFPQAFLLNVNNVEAREMDEEFLKGLFDFAFIQTLSDEDFEELEGEAAMDDEDDDLPLQNGEAADTTADDDILLSDLIVDQDSLVEEAQVILLKTVNRCASWHQAHLISSVIDHYQTKLQLDEDSREVLHAVFPEAEGKLRDGLFALRTRLDSLKHNLSVDLEDKRKALVVFVEALLLHQLYIPSLLTTDAQIVEDLENFVAVVFEGEKNDKDVNPVEVLVDLTLQLVTIDNLLAPAAGFCLKYFMRQNLNDEIMSMFASVVKPALSDAEETEEDMEDEDDFEDDMDDDMDEGAPLNALQDKMENGEEDEDLAAEAINAVASGEVTVEETDDFDQDEYMFQHDEVLREMFLIKKRDLDRQKSALSEARQSSFTAAAGVLQLVEIFVRHTHSAHDALKVFMSLLQLYVSRLKNSQPKKFAAQTHQKVLHVLSIIYKTPLQFSTPVEERKMVKGTTHKYYGRIDDLLEPLMSQFFKLLKHTHKIPSTQLQPLLEFFNTIFSTHPDRDTLIVPYIQSMLSKKVVQANKFATNKVVSFLVSLPWMAEYIGELLYPVVRKFSKNGPELFRFLEKVMDKKWDVFAKEGTLDKFIQLTLEAIKTDFENNARKEKIKKLKKSRVKAVRDVLKRIYTRVPSNMSDETKANIVELATLLHDLHSSLSWAPMVLNTQRIQAKDQRRKRKRDQMESSEEKPNGAPAAAVEGNGSKVNNHKTTERAKKRQKREAAERRKEKENGAAQKE